MALYAERSRASIHLFSPVMRQSCQQNFIHVTVTQVSCISPVRFGSNCSAADPSNSSYIQPRQPMIVSSSLSTRSAKRMTESLAFSFPVSFAYSASPSKQEIISYAFLTLQPTIGVLFSYASSKRFRCRVPPKETMYSAKSRYRGSWVML